jgi:hypothetical protein
MFKTGVILGFAAGYVLGSKAGRERYDQIVEAAKGLQANPGVQRLTEEVNKTVAVGKEKAGQVANTAVEQASSTLADKAGQAKEAVTKVANKATDKATDKSAGRTTDRNADDPLNTTDPTKKASVSGPNEDLP